MNAPIEVPTTRVARRQPGPLRAAIAATVIIAVSVLRPWDIAGAPRIPGVDPAADKAGDRIAAASSSPTPTASLAPDEIACSPEGWHVVSLDHLGDWIVRSWIPARAVRAAGPLDPAIRAVTLDGPDVLAIGACSPPTLDASGREVPGGPMLIQGAWQIDADGATPLALAARRDESTPGVATLYRPTGASATPTAAPEPWPAGRFVVALTPPGGELAAQAGARTAGDVGTAWFIGVVVRGGG